LGGAVAYLAAVDLKKMGYKIDYFFTYGAPRIGTHEFAVWFASYVAPNENWRVTHYRDMVIHQPPSAFSYKHPP
jgi:predicted lipase